MSALHELGIAAGAALLAARKLSAVEWTEALLARIAALDTQLHAFITVDSEGACAAARRAQAERDRGIDRGPLHGVPYALKDLFDSAGLPTTAHSRIAMERVPHKDATVTARLAAAGAVLVGKLALHEFAHGGPSLELPWPVARNPWDPERFAGSSSSGSGVAVAAGLVPASIGTDTGGSIRIPAGLCGIAGLKPTYGLVSRAGVIPCSWSLDHCGPMAWSAEDCAILLQAISGADARDPASSSVAIPDYRAALRTDLRGLRIGVVRHFWERDLAASDEVAAAMEAALAVLRQLGAVLEEVQLRPLQEYADVRVMVQEPEVFAMHQRDLAARPGTYGQDFLGRVLAACVLSATDYVQANRERRVMTDEMLAVLARNDALVTVGAGPAARFDSERTFGFIHGMWGKPNATSAFNVTGLPALSVCNGYSRAGMPLSMQIAARPFDDATALAIGHAYERATSGQRRRPSLDPGRAVAPIRLAPQAPAPHSSDGERDFIDRCAARAGLRLDDSQRALLHAAAPHALAMAARIRRDRGWECEPASIFSLERGATAGR
ncbi:MAG: amidase [Burkholderiales bacterium]